MEIQQGKSIRNKIYLLTIIIVALLGINFFLFYKGKKQNSKFVVVEADRANLRRQLQDIENQLNKMSSNNATLNTTLQIEKESVKRKLNELRLACATGKLSQPELKKAKHQIIALRNYVQAYQEKVADLNLENSDLKKENIELRKTADSLRNWIGSLTTKLNALTEKNIELENQLKSATALKSSNVAINVVAKKVNSNLKEIDVNKAKKVNKFEINYTLVPNLLADKGTHTVYAQVFDPSGKIITTENNIFSAEGQEMAATCVSEIEYDGEQKNYTMKLDYTPNLKGVYTVILFSDGSRLGKGNITLN